VALVACSNGESPPDDKQSGIVDGEWPYDAYGEVLAPSPRLEDLELENVIKIEYQNGSAPVITGSISEGSINAIGENIVVTIPSTSAMEYNFVLSGVATNGSLKFYGDVRKKLYLNGLNINSNSGPAINIQKSGRIIVHLINGTQNFLADGPNYKCTEIPKGEEQAKGTFFSEGKLHFEGSGSLEVKGKCNHAIVVDNDFEINNGKIVVSEAVGDGIHANDEFKVKGGFLKISSTGDAIQSEKDLVIIKGGKIKAQTTGIKSHGIASEGSTFIRDSSSSIVPIVQISVLGDGSKGIRSHGMVEFKGGKTSIKTSGAKHKEPDDESTPAGIKLAGNLYIDNGELTIKSLGSSAKGINTDGNAEINNGTVDIEADGDGIKANGTLTIKGGDVKITSKKKQAIDATSCSKTGGTINFQCGGGS
jgi:hypothetical protein